MAQAAPHRQADLRALARGDALRGRLRHREEIRAREEGRDEGVGHGLHGAGAGARRGAGRLRRRRRGLPGGEGAHALLRAQLPLLQHGVLPAVRRRDVRVRLPGAQGRLRAHRRRPAPHRVRQRHRRRAQVRSQGDRGRALPQDARPLRVRGGLRQPQLRPREG